MHGIKTKLYAYAGFSDINTVAWHSGNAGSTTHPVGTKAPNELGLFDMSGNAWELCWDWYGEYSSASGVNATGSPSGGYRVFRGGSWYIDASYARVSYRYWNDPASRSSLIGFRLARRF